MMVFIAWYQGWVPRTVRFPTAYLWVRVCGLPFEYLNTHVGEVVGQLLGRQFQVEQFDQIPESDYLRIRVCVYLDEPLVPGFFLAGNQGTLLWIQFKYEEVFKYCVRCGKIGHKSTRCRAGRHNIASSINEHLRFAADRGFVVAQTNSQYTMFNLDLRALRSTSGHTTSRVRLGNHPGIRAPAESFVERVTEFSIGEIPGGRIRPGMRFREGQAPFSAPIVPTNPNGMDGANAMDIDETTQGSNDNSNNLNPAPNMNGGMTAHDEPITPGDLGRQGYMNIGNVQDGLGRDGEGTSRMGELLGRRVSGNGMAGREAMVDGLGTATRASGISNGGLEGMNYTEMPDLPPEIADLNPYFGLDHDEYSYVNDYDLLIQESIADRIDGNVERARFHDDQRGYYQIFSMDVPLPLFYNEPLTPINEEMGVQAEGEDMAQEHGEQQAGIPDLDGDIEMHNGGATNSSGNDTHTTEEWPSGGWDTSEHNSLVSETGSPIDVAGLFNNSDYDSADQIPDLNTNADPNAQQGDEHPQQENDHVYTPVEAPWDVLASSVIGDYQQNQITVSDSGVMNASAGYGDFWRRINAMPRFKRKGIQKRTFKTLRGDCTNKNKEVGFTSTKRKALSDPGQNETAGSDRDSAQSTSCTPGLTAYKRLCLEGKAWLAGMTPRDAGEGTSRGRGKGKGKSGFVIEYSDENIVYEESMIDSDSQSVQEDKAESQGADDSGNDTNGVAGVGHEQPPTTP